MFKEKSVILFQGDSITDCGRIREDITNLGCGYPQKVKEFFNTFYSDMGYTVINKGVSGDTAAMLVDRWEEDSISLKPDVLSILIGVNDTWRRYDSSSPTSSETYEKNYRNILDRSLKANPKLEIILIEPFLIDTDPEKLNWREEDLNAKRYIANVLAREYKTKLVSAESMFSRASIEKAPAYWSGDGVHPSNEGHSILALEWLKTAGFLK